MRTEYCDCILAALRARYFDCYAMSLWHQVFLVLCIVYCVPGIRSVVYWVCRVLGIRSLGIRALCIRCDLQGHRSPMVSKHGPI